MSDDVGIAIRLEEGCGLLQKCGNAGQNFVSCCPEETTCTSANDNTYVRKIPLTTIPPIPKQRRTRAANACFGQIV